jgi:hypothetical protein
MTYQGHIENGIVVFDEPISLPDGTEVRVEVAPSTPGFWQSCSLEELACRQGVLPPKDEEELLGGWPAEERNDGFEDALTRWRQAELEQGP